MHQQTFVSWNHPCLPNIWKEFASGLTRLLVEKILLAKLCKWTEKLTSNPVTVQVLTRCGRNSHMRGTRMLIGNFELFP